jgi:hypothetical protein
MCVTFKRNQSRFFSIVFYFHVRMLTVNSLLCQAFPVPLFIGEVSPKDGNAKAQPRNEEGLTVKEQTGSLKRYPQSASVKIVTAVSIRKNCTILTQAH